MIILTMILSNFEDPRNIKVVDFIFSFSTLIHINPNCNERDKAKTPHI
jgi:hypothetical protein